VVVREGKMVGEGAYRGPGAPHAEVVALQQAGELARGATVYVTLEPCNHVRTREGQPRVACAQALVEAGVARVVYAMGDPDERTAGRGAATLAAAGIAVEAGDGAEESARVLEAYVKHRTIGLPFVIAKFAASLDGKIAAASGDSRWVAGEASRARAHEERARADAIMCGVNNVLLDDPQLTARPGGVVAARQPLRVVADSRGRTPLDAKVLGPGGPALIATTEASPREWREAARAKGAEVLVLPAGADGRVDIGALLAELGRRDVLSLLVEGGGVLLGSFFERGLVDKVTAFIAPVIVGGTSYPAVAGRGAERMAGALRLHDVAVERLGDDVLITGYTREREPLLGRQGPLTE
jgi:diaminohydroxyphosphoribosylaminopyrimidine deaminase/5-amino-6-(5-phosphoribosylamino)uracil reductase